MSKQITHKQEHRRVVKRRLQLWLWEPCDDSIERGVCRQNNGMRALHPFDPQDRALLKAVNRGEFCLIGIRNRDLQELLYATPAKSELDQRRRSAAISRKLRLLCAHGLIHKLPHTRRYQVSENGRLILNALLAAHRATIHQLMTAAA